MTTKQLEGRKVLVTGAGTGIGQGIALECARQGAEVVFHYSHSAEGAMKSVSEARALGVRATAIAADFRLVAEVKRLGQEALAFLGGLDLLVNNAGITMTRSFEEVTAEQFDTLYQVNVRAQFFLTQTLISALEAARGAIINITSVHGYQGMPGHSVYAGTKGAIVAYTRELAIELAPRGVRVNAIAPGGVWVENLAKAWPEFNIEAHGRNIPCGFVGLPSDIAKVAVFLATDAARYILGQTLVVDGGTTAWLPFGDGFRKPIGENLGKGYVPGL
jgi:NAD(P)-dependent dehydrogenase (short-subunit alcohol dehydrogenase family)